ncbi:helix-turn-helix transcriptional regulator [Candidatus Dojkabacteria bacterium]|nr:helix-turn-helix transcriptional regulator [Candidatus Dojkabacteria bacterium]
MTKDVKKISVGEQIKFYRERKNITQTDLESATNLGRGTIAKIENGIRNPKKETLTSISVALDLTLKEMANLLGVNLYTDNKFKNEG